MRRARDEYGRKRTAVKIAVVRENSVRHDNKRRVEHKADMGLGDASDQWIVEHVDDITLILHLLTIDAEKKGDRNWLRRHVWFRALAYRLDNGLAGSPLDG
jgi:hypothetical protein